MKIGCNGIVIEDVSNESDFNLLKSYTFLRTYEPATDEITDNWTVLENEILKRMKKDTPK